MTYLVIAQLPSGEESILYSTTNEQQARAYGNTAVKIDQRVGKYTRIYVLGISAEDIKK